MKAFFIGVLFLLNLYGFGQKNCNQNLDSLKMILRDDFISLIDSIRASSFSSENSKRAIPKFIRKSLSCWGKDKFRIVNPGKLYNNTDAIIGHRPMRQLNYLGLSENFILLSYNHGGFGLHGHILIFKYSNNVIEKLWSINGMANSKEEIIYNFKHIEETKIFSINYTEF